MSLEELDIIFTEWEQTFRDGWERTRLQCFYSVAPYSKEGNIKKFMPFAWDKEDTTISKPVEKSTREEFEMIKNLYITSLENG